MGHGVIREDLEVHSMESKARESLWLRFGSKAV